jgi:phage terminase small subunit
MFLQMKRSAHPPRLTLVEPGLTEPKPSRPLGEHGQALWRRVTTEYAIDDAAGVEMLTQCCQAVDLAEALSARIAEDGEIIRTMNGIKAHPAIKDGLAARGFVVRTLQKLGLNFEPLRTAPGRPPGS